MFFYHRVHRVTQGETFDLGVSTVSISIRSDVFYRSVRSAAIGRPHRRVITSSPGSLALLNHESLFTRARQASVSLVSDNEEKTSGKMTLVFADKKKSPSGLFFTLLTAAYAAINLLPISGLSFQMQSETADETATGVSVPGFGFRNMQL
ncbi:MAG: hypothetical protein RRA15_05490 [bacterium]|nr:hypothetical protein [bacterium]MDT8365929.1 hypothetical protein [bacterium]